MNWDQVGEEWRATRAPVNLEPLKKIVAAHRRRLIFVTAVEIMIVIAFAALSVFIAADGIEPWEAIWLVTLWTFTVIAVAFAVRNRRGTWDTLGESVDDYVRITRLRAERQMRTIWFACGLFLAELIAVVVQLVWFDRFTTLAAVLLASSAFAMGSWIMAVQRRVARELRSMEPTEGVDERTDA